MKTRGPEPRDPEQRPLDSRIAWWLFLGGATVAGWLAALLAIPGLGSWVAPLGMGEDVHLVCFMTGLSLGALAGAGMAFAIRAAWRRLTRASPGHSAPPPIAGPSAASPPANASAAAANASAAAANASAAAANASAAAAAHRTSAG